jgi:hypothetical protein
VVQLLPAAPSGGDPGAGAVAAGIATPAADGSFVFAPPPSAEGPTPPSDVSPEVVAPPVVVGEPTGGVTPAGPPAAASPGPKDGGSPTDLEELARRLFEPLAARLRAELRLERERTGTLPDLRQ